MAGSGDTCAVLFRDDRCGPAAAPATVHVHVTFKAAALLPVRKFRWNATTENSPEQLQQGLFYVTIIVGAMASLQGIIACLRGSARLLKRLFSSTRECFGSGVLSFACQYCQNSLLIPRKGCASGYTAGWQPVGCNNISGLGDCGVLISSCAVEHALLLV